MTELKKPLVRSIGNWMVELSATHVEVNRKYCHTKVRIAIADLIAAADQVRPPRGWVPRVDETVAVGKNRHRATVQAVIETMPELSVKVRFPRGTTKTVYLSQLVPVDSTRVLVECERVRTQKSQGKRRG